MANGYETVRDGWIRPNFALKDLKIELGSSVSTNNYNRKSMLIVHKVHRRILRIKRIEKLFWADMFKAGK